VNFCHECQRKILPYLDGELTGRDLEEFYLHLNACEGCRAQLEEERALSALLRDSRPLYTAPASLRERVEELEQSSAPARLRDLWLENVRLTLTPLWSRLSIIHWKTPVAAVAAVALALVLVPELLQRVQAKSFVETAVAAHREYVNASFPLGIQSSSSNAVTTWLNERVAFRFRLPASQSPASEKPLYRLVGAQLVKYRGSDIALVAYETDKEKISLLVASSELAPVANADEIQSSGLTFHYLTYGGFNVIVWNNHNLSYALVSSVAGSARESCMVCHQNMADHEAFKPVP